VLLAAVALLSVGCGGATKFPDEVAGDARLQADGTATTAPSTSTSASGATTTSPPTTATGTATATEARPAITTTTRAPAATARATTTRPPAATVNSGDLAIVRAASGPPGGAAGVILQPTPARSLVVEVMEEPGAPANGAAVNRVLSDLRRFSGKTVTETRTRLPAGSSARRWSERELAALADRSATVPQGNGRFALRMLFVRGQNVRSPNILAVSFRGDTFAAFPDQYASSGQNVITTVTVHEVGHLLGLVDLYLNRRRSDRSNDPAGGGHSGNRDSVMYFAVDPSLLGALFGGASDRYDAQDERDLAAIRAGAPRGSNPA